MFLLDTNVVSELRKPEGRIDANVERWAASPGRQLLYLSAMTVHELELGVLLMERCDPLQGARLRRWMERAVASEFADRIIPFDVSVGVRCAALHVPNPRPMRDSIIAATALVHGMAVVTRNVKDFAGTGVRLLNPWEPQPR